MRSVYFKKNSVLTLGIYINEGLLPHIYIEILMPD